MTDNAEQILKRVKEHVKYGLDNIDFRSYGGYQQSMMKWIEELKQIVGE